MKSLGKMMVEDDIHDLGLFDYSNRKGHIDHPSKIHHWQLGLGIWYLSEMLNLINFFFPFEKQMKKKAQIQQQIDKLREIKVDYVNRKNLQRYKQDPFRGIGRR
nr:MAG: hypothetical protein [uncultured archaeon]